MAPAFCSTNSHTFIRLFPNSTGSVAISLNGAQPVAAPTKPAIWEHANLHVPPDQPFLIIGAHSQGRVELELDSIKGWRAILPLDTYVSIRPLHHNQDLQLIADRENPALILIGLPDGGRAELNPGSSVQLETFRDHTYNLFGRGPVQARSADGALQALDSFLPPLSGGPVVQSTNHQGQVRLRRLTPATQLRLVETPGQPLTLQTDQEEIRLEVDTPRSVTLANGASIELTSKAEGIQFQVERGYFVLTLPGVRGCQPHVWSRQGGLLRWDTQLHAVEVAAENAPLLVHLPNQRHATVPPGARLQVAQMTERTFGASAEGEGVKVYDPQTRQEVLLSSTQMVMDARGMAGLGISAESEGQILLEASEPAGELSAPSSATSGSQASSWLLGLDPKQIYAPRVEQPPVSVVR